MEGSTILSTMGEKEKGMLATAINTSSGYLKRPNMKRTTPTNLNSVRQIDIDNAVRHLEVQKPSGQHKSTHLKLKNQMESNGSCNRHQRNYRQKMKWSI